MVHLEGRWAAAACEVGARKENDRHAMFRGKRLPAVDQDAHEAIHRFLKVQVSVMRKLPALRVDRTIDKEMCAEYQS